MDEGQKEALEESGMASFDGQSVTDGGVTVTAGQSIVDKYFACLIFKVEGYEPQDGEEPGFAGIDVQIDGCQGSVGSSASFYDGLIAGPGGKALQEDGTPLAEDQALCYVQEDGSMEYRITTYGSGGDLIGKTAHVKLEDLGVYEENGGVRVEKEGTWEFDWNLEGSDEIRTVDLDEPLGDSGATVTCAELSPISVRVTYDFPRQEMTEEAVDADGQPYTAVLYREPPFFCGFRMADGTLRTNIQGAGGMGYEEGSDRTYSLTTALNRVIDVDQVEGLLFLKASPEGEGEQEITEEDVYLVPIK